MDANFDDYGMMIKGLLHVSPKEAWELCKKGALIIDVRPEEMRMGKTFNTDNLIYSPYTEFAEEHTSLPRDKMLILADATGLRSRECLAFLKEKGYSNAANLTGGILEWERDGLPVNTNKAELKNSLTSLRQSKRHVKVRLKD
jgi:rhodanese-related sulfurtransferase